MFWLSSRGTLFKETLLISLTFLIILLYPLIFTFFGIAYLYRYAIQQIVLRDPKFNRIFKGLDAVLAAHNTYNKPSCILLPAYNVNSTVDIDHIKRSFAKKILNPPINNGQCLYPEMMQKIVKKFGYNWWVTVDNFKLDDHFRHLDMKDPERVITLDEMLKISKETLCYEPFNPDRSPWEFIIAKNYSNPKQPETKSAIIFRCHHCMADGFSIIQVMQKLAEKPWYLSAEMKSSYNENSLIRNIVKCLLLFFSIPYHSLKMMFFTCDNNPWARRVLDNPTNTMRGKYLYPLPLDELKSIKNRHKVSMSSLIYAINAEAILNTLARDNVYVDNFHIAVPFPLPNHPKDKLVNQWSMVKIPVKVVRNNPVETLKNIDKEFKKVQSSIAPLAWPYLPKLAGLLPTILIPVPEEGINATSLFSNLPGPLHEADIFGYSVTQIAIGANAPKGYPFYGSCISYKGRLYYALGGDGCNFRTEEDVDFLVQCYYKAFNTFRGGVDQNIIYDYYK